MTPEKRQQEIAEIDESLDRWFRKLKRAANAIDQLRAKRKRLTAIRKLLPHELEPAYSKAKVKLPMSNADDAKAMLNDILDSVGM